MSGIFKNNYNCSTNRAYSLVVFTEVDSEWQQYKDDRSTRRLMYNVHTNLSGCRTAFS